MSKVKVSQWVSESVSQWQGHLLSCSGQLKKEWDPDHPGHIDHPDYPDHAESLTTLTKKSVQSCDFREVLHSCFLIYPHPICPSGYLSTDGCSSIHLWICVSSFCLIFMKRNVVPSLPCNDLEPSSRCTRPCPTERWRWWLCSPKPPTLTRRRSRSTSSPPPSRHGINVGKSVLFCISKTKSHWNVKTINISKESQQMAKCTIFPPKSILLFFLT